MPTPLCEKRRDHLAAALASPFVAVVVAGCGLGSHDATPCDPAAPPTCADGTTRVTCDADGTQRAETCAAACLAMADNAGRQTAACVPSGAVACQSAAFAPACVGGNVIVTCAVVAPLEGAGHTALTACSSETTCRESALAVACVDPTSEVCDPATHVETCDGCEVVGFDARVFCAPGTTCATR
jgi:hypothetical protein